MGLPDKRCRAALLVGTYRPAAELASDRAEMSAWRYDSYVRFLDELLALEKVNAERTSKVESGMKARGGRTGQEERQVKVDAADREANRRTMKQQLANFDFEEDEDLDDDVE